MSDAISWVLAVSIKDGKDDEFRALMDEMVASTRDEPGAQIYEWFVSADGKQVHIYERYADNEATMAHSMNFGKNFGQRFFGCVDPVGMWVYGDVSDDVRAALAAAGPEFLGSLGGFAR